MGVLNRIAYTLLSKLTFSHHLYRSAHTSHISSLSFLQLRSILPFPRENWLKWRDALAVILIASHTTRVHVTVDSFFLRYISITICSCRILNLLPFARFYAEICHGTTKQSIFCFQCSSVHHPHQCNLCSMEYSISFL